MFKSGARPSSSAAMDLCRAIFDKLPRVGALTLLRPGTGALLKDQKRKVNYETKP